MTGIIARKYEATLCKIAGHVSFSPIRLDLSTTEAATLKKLIAEVKAQYELDFPPTPTPLNRTLGTTADANDCLDADSRVKMDEAELTAMSYQEGLMSHDAAVQSHRKRALDTYISANAAIVVDDGADTERRKRKLIALPVAAEKKRKLFVKDFLVAQGLDRDKLKTKHQSMFDPINPRITEEVMDQTLEIYQRLKSDGDDRKSADHMAVIVPGPPPNNWENKNVATVMKYLKKGMMNSPKVGRIEHPQADVLQRTKGKLSFTGQVDNFLVFASEKRTVIPRKSMTFLGGDSLFNKWVVPLIPVAALHKVDVATTRTSLLSRRKWRWRVLMARMRRTRR